MTKYIDAIIVGGGHNGLTAAAYLGRAGKRILVLEKRAIVGGAAVTEEFYPGYRNSSCSYVASTLHPRIVSELELERHGLRFLPVSNSFYPKPDGSYLLSTGDIVQDCAQLAKFSETDWEGKSRLDDVIAEVADLLRPMLLRAPPALVAGSMGLGDLFAAGKLGWTFRQLSPESRQRVVQFFTSSVRQLVERYIESDAARLLYYSSATTGSMSDISQPGSAINLLHLSMGEIAGKRGGWAFVRGGMGGVSDAIAASALEGGAEIRTNSGVERILVENGRAVGVCLHSNEVIRSRCVVSNCEPKMTFLKLLDDDVLEKDFQLDIRQWRTESGCVRMNFALNELPDFACLPGVEQGPQHEGFITLIPSTESIDRAYLSARAGNCPEEPLITLAIPSTKDDTLTTAGHHVMSAMCQHFPYQLSDGKSWDDCREAVADLIVDTIAKYAPNLPTSIVGRQILSPLDLEREYGLTGGDVYHGKVELDQLFAMRPHASCSGYETPVPGLYLCGAGTHPGGGVSGMPGHNAAKVVIRGL